MSRTEKLKGLEKMGWKRTETKALILELAKFAHDRAVVPEELALRCAQMAGSKEAVK